MCQQVHSISSHIPNWFHCEFSRVTEEATIYDSVCLCDSQNGMLADSRETMGLINNIWEKIELSHQLQSEDGNIWRKKRLSISLFFFTGKINFFLKDKLLLADFSLKKPD